MISAMLLAAAVLGQIQMQVSLEQGIVDLNVYPIPALDPNRPSMLFVDKTFDRRIQPIQAQMHQDVVGVMDRYKEKNSLWRVFVIPKFLLKDPQRLIDHIVRERWKDSPALDRTLILVGVISEDMKTIDMRLWAGKEFPLGKLQGVDLNGPEGPFEAYKGLPGKNPAKDVGYVLNHLYWLKRGSAKAIPWKALAWVSVLLLFSIRLVRHFAPNILPKPVLLDSRLDASGTRFGYNFPWTYGLGGTLLFLIEMMCVWIITLVLAQELANWGTVPGFIKPLLNTPAANLVAMAFGLAKIRPTANGLAEAGLGVNNAPLWSKILCGVLALVALTEFMVYSDYIVRAGGDMLQLSDQFFDVVVLAPLHEEPFYRLVLFNLVNKGLLNAYIAWTARRPEVGDSLAIKPSHLRWVLIVSMTITSVIFMAGHVLFYPGRWDYPIYFTVRFTLMGLLFNAAYVKGRTLALPILVHACANGLSSCLMISHSLPI